MKYRIFWPDLGQYSNHKSWFINDVILHAYRCESPFEIRLGDMTVCAWDGDWLTWNPEYQAMAYEANEAQRAYQRVAG